MFEEDADDDEDDVSVVAIVRPGATSINMEVLRCCREDKGHV